MSQVEFPDWAKPGEKVLSVSSRYGESSAVEGVIVRLTATRIVVKFPNYERQYVTDRMGEWEEYGRKSDTWSRVSKLIHAESEQGKKLYDDALKVAKKNRAYDACKTFTRTRGVIDAYAAVKALQEFIDSERVTPGADQ